MSEQEEKTQAVTVTDIDIPFTSMVRFMVKWAIASIPALLFLLIFGGIALALLSAIGLHR